MSSDLFRAAASAIMLGMIIAFAIGYWAGIVRDSPNCPQEDSCRPDYYDGEWHIIELQPWEI